MIVDLLPAADGDALLLTWDSGGSHKHILVDGGRVGSHAGWAPIVEEIVGRRGRLELLVVTHVDADHVGGILSFLREEDPSPSPGSIWFNGQSQVADAMREVGLEPFGVAQADKVSKLIDHHALPLNVAFGGGAVLARTPPACVAVCELALTILSPDPRSLASMGREWTRWLAAEGLREGAADPPPAPPGLEPLGSRKLDVTRLAAAPETIDRSVPNGSSIAFVAEHLGKRVLFCADAHPDVLKAGLDRYASCDGKVPLDLVKVGHHGGATNTTRALLSKIDCTRFAFSTNGTRHGHPDEETVARILCSTERHKTLYFNYRQPQTTCWDDDGLMEEFNYSVTFPTDCDGHLRILV